MQVVTAIGEPAAILDVWDGARLAVVVDAAFGDSSRPGIVRRWTPGDETTANMVSSHAFGLPQTYALGSALGRLPQSLSASPSMSRTSQGSASHPRLPLPYLRSSRLWWPNSEVKP